MAIITTGIANKPSSKPPKVVTIPVRAKNIPITI